MSLRISLGDFDLDNFDGEDDTLAFIVFRWSIWMIGAFALNVIFMNFIIAVISKSYEKTM